MQLSTRIGLIVIFGSLSFAPRALAQVTVGPGALMYSQDFDSLAASGANNTWANNSTLPGWALFHQPAPGSPITTYNAGDGTSNAGNFYSFGTTSATERAFGGLGSGNTYFGNPGPGSGAVAGWIAVGFTNNTGQPIERADISFDDEQWRNGGNVNAQTMVLEYGFGDTFVDVAAWTAPGGNFDWSSPVTGATGAAVNGNVEGLVAGRGGLLSGLDGDFTNGSTLWVRWIEVNDAGNDHGLAIDNFVVTFTPVPEPASVLALSGLIVGAAAGLRARRRVSG